MSPAFICRLGAHRFRKVRVEELRHPESPKLVRLASDAQHVMVSCACGEFAWAKNVRWPSTVLLEPTTPSEPGYEFAWQGQRAEKWRTAMRSMASDKQASK